MLTPAGLTIFRSYVTGLIWLQSWGPLYAVLHRISMGEAAERMSAAAAMPGGEAGISLVAQAGIRAVASDVAVMSGYLSMSVPFLAAALAYGLSKATVLATSVLAVGQDAASAAAHEGTTGNLSLANTGYDTHRFATLEGRQIRTSGPCRHRPLCGICAGRGGFVVTGDGTAVVDAGSATSRIPAAGVRLSEALATSNETRAAEAASIARNWDVQVGVARNAAVTDATGLVERYSHDVSVGEAHARGVTESESAQVQALESHYEKLAEIGGITKNQAAVLTGEGEDRRRTGEDRRDRRERQRDLARRDHRERRLEPDAGIRPPARGDGFVVEGLGGVAALLGGDRRERGGRAGGEPQRQSHPDAELRRAGVTGAAGVGDVDGAGGARCVPTRRPSTVTSPSPSSPGCRSARARTAGRSARPGRAV